MPTLSVRRLWIMYKRIAIAQGVGASKRDLQIAGSAFYTGARGVLKVLSYLLERGDYDELHRAIERQGRQIGKIQARGPPARRH